MKKKLKRYWQQHKRNWLVFLLLLVISIVFTLVFSVSTSPLYPNYYTSAELNDGGDSLQFQQIGEGWLDGKVPYRDMFDHKGPIIFLINMMGFGLGNGTRYGIMVFQIIALVITLIFIWKISQLAKKSFRWGLISTLVTLIFIGTAYMAGNSVAGYSLAFIMPGIYLMIRYFYQKKNVEHDIRWAFVYGLGIGASILLQATHALALVVGVLVIGIVLIQQKMWKNFWQNILAGLAGILIIWLPFALYFLINDAFDQFMFASITYNLLYATRIGSWLKNLTNGAMVFEFFMAFFPFICLIFTVIMAFLRKKYIYSGFLALLFFVEAYMFFGGALYYQYILPFVFQVPLLLNEMVLFDKSSKNRKIFYYVVLSILAIVAGLNIFGCVQQTVKSAKMIDEGGFSDLREMQEAGLDMSEENPGRVADLACWQILDEYYPQIKDHTIDIYTSLGLKHLYFLYDLEPNNRFFIVQDWHGLFSEEVRKEIAEDFQNNQPDYLLSDVDYDPEKGFFYIHETVEQNYHTFAERDGCTLYQRND